MIVLQRTLMTVLLVSFMALSSQAASFEKYFLKLVKFEGKGYGINQEIWGKKVFSKEEAFRIHKQHYWNKYHGNLFKSQEVAEVFIDQLINAGEGKECVNIKAFEAVIGVSQDGKLTKEDVQIANSFIQCEYIVNPYTNYRLHYYTSRKNFKKYPGWTIRAKAFSIFSEDNNMLADYLVLPDMLIGKEPEEDLEESGAEIASKVD